MKHRTASVLFVLVIAGCVKPTPSPTPTPAPTPTPTPCVCYIPDSNDPGWVGTIVDVPWNEAAVRMARNAVGDRCGKPVDETYALLAEQLRVLHVCALGPWGDSVLVSRPDVKLEEWKLVQSNGCWSSLAESAHYNAALRLGGFKQAWTHPKALTCVKEENQ